MYLCIFWTFVFVVQLKISSPRNVIDLTVACVHCCCLFQVNFTWLVNLEKNSTPVRTVLKQSLRRPNSLVIIGHIPEKNLSSVRFVDERLLWRTHWRDIFWSIREVSARSITMTLTAKWKKLRKSICLWNLTSHYLVTYQHVTKYTVKWW